MDTSATPPSDCNGPEITVPMDISATLQGSNGETEQELRALWEKLFVWVGVISTQIDLATLEGITAVTDYRDALANFDRGVEALKERAHRLEPTNDGNAIGVAMTPTCIRDGQVKSHMFFHFDIVRGIGCDRDSDEFQAALHTLAHECAHVEVVARFDSAFPGTVLRERPADWTELDSARWKYAIDGCWKEYLVCRKSAKYGKSPLDGYVEVLLNTLDGVPQAAARMVDECRRDKDYGKLFYGLCQLYGDLMKYACYVLGTMHGLALTIEELPTLKAGLATSWFARYFDRLDKRSEALHACYGIWQDHGAFDALGDLLEELVATKGVAARPEGDDLYVSLNVALPPFTKTLYRSLFGKPDAL